MNTRQCESCAYYSYDEEYEEYFCSADIDEDEYYRMTSDFSVLGKGGGCKFYRNGDEYSVVRRQN